MRQSLLLLAALWLAGCANSSQGELLAHSDRATVRSLLDTKTDFHKKRVAVDGYLFLSGDSSTESDGKIGLSLYTKPFGEGDRLLDVECPSGQGKNQAYFPTVGKGKTAGYKTSQYNVDVEAATFTDNAGKPHSLKEKLRLSGTVLYVDHFQGGFSHQEDPLHKGVQLYPFALRQPRFDLAP